MEHALRQGDSIAPSYYRMAPLAVKKRIQRLSYVPVGDGGERMTRRNYLNGGECKTMSDGASLLSTPLLQRAREKCCSVESDSSHQKSFSFTRLCDITSSNFPQLTRQRASSSSSATRHLPPVCLTSDLPQQKEFEEESEISILNFDAMSVELTHLSSPPASDNSSEKTANFSIKPSDLHQPEVSAEHPSSHSTGMTKKDGVTTEPSRACVVYARTCQMMEIPISQSLYRCLQLTVINLKYQILSQHQFRALAVALAKNWSVTSLNLSSTGLTDVSFRYLAEVLRNNFAVLELSATDNKLTGLSAQLLQEVMERNAKLQTIDMSGNSFKDADAICFAQIIQTNRNVKKMVLNHGSFGDEAGCILGRALCLNQDLEVLDVSWNQFRRDSAWQLIIQCSLNDALKCLDLSWNGLGQEGCDGLAEFLKVNTTLTELNIASNRITQQAFRTLTKGLIKNHTLQHLKLGNNPITHGGVLEFLAKLKFLQLSKVCMLEALRLISFDGILVGVEVRKLAQSIRHGLPNLQFVFGSQSQEVEACHSAPMRESVKLTSYQAKCLLYDSLVRAGLDPEHILPKSKAIKWYPLEVKDALLAISVSLSEGAIDDILRLLSENGVITPSDILNRNKTGKKKNCHLSAHSHKR